MSALETHLLLLVECINGSLPSEWLARWIARNECGVEEPTILTGTLLVSEGKWEVSSSFQLPRLIVLVTVDI